MGSDFKVFWTDEAIKNLQSIMDYLDRQWSQREIDNFKKKLAKQIELIEINPKLFPVSEYNPRLRKAVLSKQTIIFYEIANRMIYFVYLFNSRQDIENIV
jgi:plasmid stabilization system protein ParE